MSGVAETRACGDCSGPVDPLRAARVACFDHGFVYFCSAECDARYRRGEPHVAAPKLRTKLASELVSPAAMEGPDAAVVRAAARALSAVEGDPEAAPPRLLDGESEPRESQPGDAAPLVEDGGSSTDASTLLLTLSAVGGALSLVLSLTGSSETALTARLLVVAVAVVALAAECVMGERRLTELHPFALLGGPLAALLSALGFRLSGRAEAEAALALGGVVVLTSALSLLLVRRVRRPLELERRHVNDELESRANRIVTGGEVEATEARDLRPGEEIVVEAGETFAVDATVTAGSALILPWLAAKAPVERREGDSVVGGARVVEGRLRAVVGWAGNDRAWVRLLADPQRRADLHAPWARHGRLAAARIAPIAAGLAGLVAFGGSGNLANILELSIATYAALSQAGVAEVPSIHMLRGVLLALGRGVAFRSAEALDLAGRVSSVAFCARGTLLLGEPEVTRIDALAGQTADEVLALAAGAEANTEHPTATAVLRAARARSIRPDAVRSPTAIPGVGVTAVAGSGQSLAVGSRALMLRERIGVASAEQRISDLEAMGRSVLLVALGGRLVGVIGLQDGLRPGARAAVQHVLDVGIEPILLSGDARETCEAIGHALDIDHLRPEVPPSERGDEVKRLRDGGAVVAVVGRTPADDNALAAADVAVALSAAGSGSSEWGVQLASDDVRDAAYSLRVAHEARREAQLGLLVTLAPAFVTIVVSAFGFAPGLLSPIATCLGTVAALSRARRER